MADDVEPLQRCDRCLVMCSPGMACVSADPGHVNAEQPCRPAAETSHPSENCFTCLDYLDFRRDRLPTLIAEKALRDGRPGIEVFVEFMDAAHQRHLDGQPLRPDGPTRVIDPYLGRLAAVLALGVGVGGDSDG